MRTKYIEYANLIKDTAFKYGDERASKCGYDLMIGLHKGNDAQRAEAWARYFNEDKDGSHTDEEREGCWCPAIPL